MTDIYATPRVPRDVVSRARLSSRLATDAPLVVVRAPAGSGKTVAVADWAQRLGPGEAAGVWFTVDAGSANRLAFWQGLVQVMVDAGLVPEGTVLRTSLTAFDTAPDLRRLLLRGFAQLAGELVLVIDDFHIVSDSGVQADIVALLEASARLKIIAITRLRSELELEAVAIALGPEFIATPELMFTPAETAELVERVEVPDADGAIVDALQNATGGLPLTTRGVLLLMQREGFDLNPETVRTHLASAGAEILRDVWAMQVGEDRDIDFAIRCSVADHLTTQLAVALTGREDAAAVFDLAESIGMGWWADGANDRVFAFTAAVRVELRRELARRFPLEVEQLTRVTAQWCLEQGQAFTAFKHAIAIQDFALAGRVLTLDHSHILGFHRQELVELLEPLPLSTLRKQPIVAMVLAMALNMSGMHRVRAVELFALAGVSARAMGGRVTPVERAVLLTIENGALRVTGQATKARAAAERTAAHFESLTLEQKDQLQPFTPVLLVHTGLSFLYSGRAAKALECFQAAYALPPGTSKRNHLHALALTAGTHAVNGDMREAKALVEVARNSDWPAGQREGYIGAFYQLAEGMLALEAEDYSTALHRVALMEPHLATIEHWPLFMYVRSMALLGTGRALEGATTLGAAIQRGAHPVVTTFTRAWLDATRARLLIAAGQSHTAEYLLKRHPRPIPAIAIEQARLQLTLGKPDAARLALRPLNEESLSTRLRSSLLLLRAASAVRLGETELALDTLEHGLVLLQAGGLRMPFLLVPATDRAALADAASGAGRQWDIFDDLLAAPTLLMGTRESVALTEREQIVLTKLVTISSTVGIAAELFVSTNTVKSQLRSLYRKLGAASREEALRKAGERGLLRG